MTTPARNADVCKVVAKHPAQPTLITNHLISTAHVEPMGNKNYQKGVRFERARKAHYEAMGWEVLRTAGSHGQWDLVGIDWPYGIVTFIQCKTTKDLATAKRMLVKFRANPPRTPTARLHQTLEVKVTGSTEVHSVTV